MTNPETEVVTEGYDAPEDEGKQDIQDEEVENEIEEEPSDEEEIELDGERYSVPKKLKGAFMMNADYTRKTQEAAEQRKNFETERNEFKQHTEAQRANLQSYAEAHSLKTRLDEYQKLDWTRIADEDPAQAVKLQIEYQGLKDKFTHKVNEISNYENEQGLKKQQETAKRFEETKAVCERDIPNWSPELARKIDEKGRELGYTPQELDSLALDARAVKTLHKALLYDQIIEKQARQKQQPPEAKPVKTLGKSNKATSGLSDNLSTDEWIKRRNSQLHKRRS